MLNIEKYKDEIAKVGYDFALMGDNLFYKCSNCDDCAGCKFDGGDDGCIVARVSWLMKEYKESILTDEAKSYLKLILEPTKCTIIQKLVEGEEASRKYKLLCSTDSGYIAILYKPGTKYYEYFKNMENDKAYTPEELDL